MNKLILSAFVALSASQIAMADVVYSNIPGTLADNYPSLGYQATSTAEFGDRVNLGGTSRNLVGVTTTLSSWAHQEDYDPSGVTTSYSHPLTLNIYQAGSGNLPGALIGSVTQSASIPYRPVGWTANGIAFNVTFDFSSLGITLPESVVVALAFNTQSYGTSPIGANGPYNSLNFALNEAAGGGITVGSNDNLDDVMWNTSHAAFYTDGGVGGVGILRQDTNWTPDVPMIEINAIPAPTSLAMMGAAGLFAARRRRA